MGDILNMAKDFIHQENIPKVNPVKQLKIDKRLPQILIPANKIQLFIDWWNSDIRFEKSIPHSFDEGYMIIDTGEYDRHHYSSAEIKALAIEYHTTYRYIENIINDFFKNVESFTLYFKFTSDNSMFVETYGKDGKIISNMEFAVGRIVIMKNL